MTNLIRRLMLAAGILLILTAAANAQSSSQEIPRSEIEIRGIVAIPSGEARVLGTTAGGNTIDFHRDFDFKNQVGYELRYTYRSESKKHKFFADYNHIDWSRSVTLSRSFTFQGETYVANFTATGDLTLGYFRGMYAYRWGTGKLRIGPMADMGVITTRVKVSGMTNHGAASGEKSISRFAATIGYDLDYDASPKVNIFSNLGAIAFQGEHFLHTETGVRVYASHHLGVTGGYKYSRYKVKDNDNFITVRAHGPFFGGVFRF